MGNGGIKRDTRYKQKDKVRERVTEDILGLGMTSRFVETGPISTRSRSQNSVLHRNSSTHLSGSFPPPTRDATHGKQLTVVALQINFSVTVANAFLRTVVATFVRIALTNQMRPNV
ncbi:hypothetical protein CHS0354_040234, partial [Potamilus streckersoni]